MASVLGMLEERESAARVRVEGLPEEVARSAEVLEAAEIELDRRVIAREELVEALAVSAAKSTAVTTAEAEENQAPSLAPVPGSTVPPWREGLPATVLATNYQRILDVLDQQRSTGHGPLRTKEIAVRLGLEATPAKVEGLRSKARRLAERGWLLLEASGAFSGHRPPRDPARDQVTDRVQQLPVAVALGPSAPPLKPGRHRQQRPDLRPLRVRHIRRIPAHPIRMIGRVAVHVREAIARHGRRVEVNRLGRVQQRVALSCITWGVAGWLMLGGVFVLAGLAMPYAVRWADKAPAAAAGQDVVPA
ncbi:hypothetical protein [Streptomyces coeruleorubidus]|uniref:hypothetical protein n=1 Tax=Streptomyces coeruleorubidus TaxID=116188 RepID=UPI00365EE6EF